MSWIKAKFFPISQDLTALDKSLSYSKVAHRITEENGQQVLWVPGTTDPDDLESIIKESENQTATGIPSNDESPTERHSTQTKNIKKLSIGQQAQLTPATSSFIIFGFIGYILIRVVPNPDLNLLTLFFSPVRTALQSAEVWRLLTPAFLHFGVLHILFNSLWMWELGRRLELYLGFKKYVFVFAIIAIGANYIQFSVSNNIYFGGLSGVVYGFLGLLLVLSRYASHPTLQIPSGIYIFMIIFMLLGVFKVVDLFMVGSVANGAHVGGFFFGIIIGGLMFIRHTIKHQN